MKEFLMMLLMLPLMGVAQVKNDAKYLAKDAVPVENGRVIFTKVLEVPMGVTELYSAVQEWANEHYTPIKEMPS